MGKPRGSSIPNTSRHFTKPQGDLAQSHHFPPHGQKRCVPPPPPPHVLAGLKSDSGGPSCFTPCTDGIQRQDVAPKYWRDSIISKLKSARPRD